MHSSAPEPLTSSHPGAPSQRTGHPFLGRCSERPRRPITHSAHGRGSTAISQPRRTGLPRYLWHSTSERLRVISWVKELEPRKAQENQSAWADDRSAKFHGKLGHSLLTLEWRRSAPSPSRQFPFPRRRERSSSKMALIPTGTDRPIAEPDPRMIMSRRRRIKGRFGCTA
jgi:hypothetical protein